MHATDRLWIAAILAVAAAAIVRYGLFGAAPAEDATMLFRYADNVAAGRGIVWNPGEHPVDGATDLLFMLVLAGLERFHVTAETAALIVNSASLLATLGLIYTFARRQGLGSALATLAAAFVLVSPVVTYVQAGFTAPTFGFAIGVCAVLTIRHVFDARARARTAWLLGAAISVAGLIRPEGFLIGGAFVIVIAGTRGRAAAADLGRIAIVVGATAGAFTLWRWHYFGFPLPNPYYRKGSGRLHKDGLVSAADFAISALSPVLLILAIGLLRTSARRLAAASLVAIGFCTSIWVLLSNETNFDHRFQYPTLVLSLVFATVVLERLLADVSPVSWARVSSGSIAACLAVPAAMLVWTCPLFYSLPDRRLPAQARVARALATAPGTEHVVVSTEAGYVCWASGWTCIDAWGLNDQHIAHHGFLTEADLASIRPDVIFVHAPTSPLMTHLSAARDMAPEWTAMTGPLIRFAETRGYALAAVLNPQNDSCMAVFVRNDSPVSGDVTRALREIDVNPYPPGRLLPLDP